MSDVTSGVPAGYPLPWTAECDAACARIVAANGATVLACDVSESSITRFIAASVSANCPELPDALAALASVLAAPDAYATDADFVDALITAAEAAVAIAPAIIARRA